MAKRYYLAMLMFAASVCFGIGARAEAAAYLIVELTSGDKQAYALSEQPKISFADGKELTVTCSELTASYPIPEVARFSFSDEDTGISAPLTDKSFSFAFEDNHLIKVTAHSPKVSVFDINGRALRSFDSKTDSAVFDIDALPAGVYIVTINNVKSVKVVKK